ncbi:MAG: alpha/beta fold hydrolase [Desulfobacterales bacterium]|nr:alpha/beta fold hydrolase [Desulfobacterales bacterium]
MVAGSKKGVVVTHPHPLYGGNMNNPVVRQVSDSFYKNNFSTLRFNFRGTGLSSGGFEDGAGEQDDVHAALDFLRGQGVSFLFLAGYSFGAWVNAQAVSSGIAVDGHIMVSPPPDQIRHLMDKLEINPEFCVLNGCDHFYAAAALDDLGQCIHSYLNS